MPRFYLNSFKPLVHTPAGRTASKKHSLPPFIDGSIRREPDLEHERPSITCLCRTNKFAPRLKVGDLVCYMTCNARFGTRQSHRRMIAVLRIDLLFDSHREAANWYRSQGLPLPSNCMVPGNAHCPLDHSHRVCKSSCSDDDGLACGWDGNYARRANKYGRFVVCTCLWKDLDWSAPTIQDRDLVRTFGKIPATRTPGAFGMDKSSILFDALGVTLSQDTQPSSPCTPPTAAR